PATGAGVLTQHNDNQRTGATLGEVLLTPALVGSGGFGKLYCQDVDDELYAQILYVPAVDVAGAGKRNLLVVATVNNTVCAFDADAPAASAPLWQASYNTGAAAPFTAADASQAGACHGDYQDVSGNMGIMGTPVVDPIAATVY